MEFWYVKNSTTDSKAPNYRLITILLVSKPPDGIDLVLGIYKRDSHDLWLLCGLRELRERSKYATFAFFQNFKNRLSNEAKQTVTHVDRN